MGSDDADAPPFARLANARASADRLRALYADAADVNQIVTIEKALTERETEVEALAGKLQSLEDRADRSTLTVSFVKVGEPTEVEPEDDASLFVRGLRRGWDTVTALGGGASAVAGFLVPLLPFAAVIGAVVVVVRRRRRRGIVPLPPPSPVATRSADAPEGPGTDADGATRP